MSDVHGLNAWELEGWIAPSDEGLPGWLRDLRQQHLAAVAEYQAAIAGVVAVGSQGDSDARAWRRAVRDAIAVGSPPPKRTFDAEVSAAQVQVAQEDAEVSRLELAEVACAVLKAIRERRDEFAAHYFAASAELRVAVGHGPDGYSEGERQRRKMQEEANGIVDVSLRDPDLDDDQEMMPDAAAA